MATIENVADAIDSVPSHTDVREQRLAEARAAIKAMREPSEAVAVEVAYAASAVLGQPITEGQAQEMGTDIFQAGIDMILQEPHEGKGDD